MIVSNASTLLNVAEAAAIVILGASSTWYSKRSVKNTQNISNGFAKHTTESLQQIQAHLAAQDMHAVAQDVQVAQIMKTLDRHDALLTQVAISSPTTVVLPVPEVTSS